MTDMQALIAEARTPQYSCVSDEVWERNGSSPAERDDLVRRLTEALEAASTRLTPEPRDRDRAIALVNRYMALNEDYSNMPPSEYDATLEQATSLAQDLSAFVEEFADGDLCHPASEEAEQLEGRIVTLAFEDGVKREPYCGLEDCECPDHEYGPSPAGHYITIRLDGEPRIGFSRVTVLVSPEQDGGRP